MARPAGTAPWRHRLAGAVDFARRQVTGEGEVDEFGFDPEFNSRLLIPVARRLTSSGSGSGCRAWSMCRRPAPALVVANHSGALPLDAIMLQTGAARRASGAPQPAAARRGPGLRGARAVLSGPPVRAHPGLPGQRPPAAARRRAGRRVPGGVQGHRQAVPRPVPAAPVRPRRVRGVRAARPGADHPVRDRRRRGDLPDDGQRQAAGPGRCTCPTSRSPRCSRGWAWSARCRCRRSGSSSSARRCQPRATRRARGGTRPRSPTWPPRSATWCSASSMSCWPSAARRSADQPGQPGPPGQLVLLRWCRRRSANAAAIAADHGPGGGGGGQRDQGRLPAGPEVVYRPVVASRLGAQPGVRVDRVRLPDQAAASAGRWRVAVRGAAGQVQALALGQRATAAALASPCSSPPTSRPVYTPSTDSATVPSAPVSPSRCEMTVASSTGVAVTSHTRWPARRWPGPAHGCPPRPGRPWSRRKSPRSG